MVEAAKKGMRDTDLVAGKVEVFIKRIFQEIDKDGDGSLDVYELHSALFAKGILAPIDAVTTLFNHIDSNNDGLVSHDELSLYMIKPLGTKTRETFQSLFCQIDVQWICYLLIGVGGALFAVGGCSEELSLADHTANMYLAGSFMYAFTSSRDIALSPINFYQGLKSFERTAKNLQISLKKKASGFTIENNITNAHDSSTTIDELYIFLEEVIFEREKMTKSDLELALLKEVGSVSDLLVLQMFNVMDTDNNGTIDAKEMHKFIHGLDEKVTCSQRLYKVLKATLTNVAWQMSMAFAIALYIVITQNIITRFEFGKDGLWVSKTITPFFVSSHLFLVGTLGFSAQAYNRQVSSYELAEKVRNMIESFLEKEKNVDETMKSTTGTSNLDNFRRNSALDKAQFNKLLEENGVFLPRPQLDAIYEEIDTDNGGTICKKELESFAKKKKRRNIAIWKDCFRSFSFLSNSIWFLGSTSYCFTIYVPNNNFVGAWGNRLGGIFYFLGGVFLCTTYVQLKMSYFDYVRHIRHALLYMTGVDGPDGSINEETSLEQQEPSLSTMGGDDVNGEEEKLSQLKPDAYKTDKWGEEQDEMEDKTRRQQAASRKIPRRNQTQHHQNFKRISEEYSISYGADIEDAFKTEESLDTVQRKQEVSGGTCIHPLYQAIIRRRWSYPGNERDKRAALRYFKYGRDKIIVMTLRLGDRKEKEWNEGNLNVFFADKTVMTLARDRL